MPFHEIQALSANLTFFHPLIVSKVLFFFVMNSHKVHGTKNYVNEGINVGMS